MNRTRRSRVRESVPKKALLILCTGNSPRSQMAGGLLRDMAGDGFDLSSAGGLLGLVAHDERVLQCSVYMVVVNASWDFVYHWHRQMTYVWVGLEYIANDEKRTVFGTITKDAENSYSLSCLVDGERRVIRSGLPTRAAARIVVEGLARSSTVSARSQK